MEEFDAGTLPLLSIHTREELQEKDKNAREIKELSEERKRLHTEKMNRLLHR
ncbi:hypothetical protein AGMMS49556_06050 [Endomicrobiia bacterium]|nr:hypothetical protein AGMMS49556_06050 [Endomicrobiia bacterium]